MSEDNPYERPDALPSSIETDRSTRAAFFIAGANAIYWFGGFAACTGPLGDTGMILGWCACIALGIGGTLHGLRLTRNRLIRAFGWISLVTMGGFSLISAMAMLGGL